MPGGQDAQVAASALQVAQLALHGRHARPLRKVPSGHAFTHVVLLVNGLPEAGSQDVQLPAAVQVPHTLSHAWHAVPSE